MPKIETYIDALIEKVTLTGLIKPRDMIYVRNQILGLLNLNAYQKTEELTADLSIPEILDELIDFAIQAEVIEDVFDEKEMLSANIMNCFMPSPSEMERSFYEKYAILPKLATEYFYKVSQTNNYIQTQRIAQNIHFKKNTSYGELDITINLSKPEKDPEQIRREKEMKKVEIDYPKCVLCIENEGYIGRTGYAARANHRMIKMSVAGEPWYFQYSPYVYYNEHSILLSEEHRDMVINRDTFIRLLDFVTQFPHYFIGSNADLPIVGGSILSHDHYQAGNYTFAMTNAQEHENIEIRGYENVKASILQWPLSVIRLKSERQADLVSAADAILKAWINYSDESVEVVSHTGETRHNTITPIARKRNNVYELDLVLRNNRTTEDAPYGLFHPQEDVHHIKKENIGLIEVMGLAVLPARLKEELQAIRNVLRGKSDVVADYHHDWLEELKATYGTNNNAEEAEDIVEQELANKFARVLEDAGVFKQTKEGIEAFKKFINQI